MGIDCIGGVRSSSSLNPYEGPKKSTKDEDLRRKTASPEKIIWPIQKPRNITDLNKNPHIHSLINYTLNSIFSFLTPEEREEERLVCRRHNFIYEQYIPISKRTIVENGYGDFLLINAAGRLDTEAMSSAYKKAFPIFNWYLTQVSKQPVDNRLQKVNQLLKEKLPEYPHLKAIFIPRVVYELFYLMQGAEEEFELLQKQTQCSKKADCCHSLECSVKGSEMNLNEHVISLAYRLNCYIIQKLGPLDAGLTEQQYQNIGRKILRYFKEQTPKLPSETNELFCIISFPILIKNLLGIMIDSNNLNKIIALECSKRADNAVILYRGSRFRKEPWKTKELWNPGIQIPYAASYGLSFFAGYLNDLNASAAGRILYDEETRHSYALAVPVSQLENVFDCPPVNTMCGLNGMGELFHARSKVIEPPPERRIGGITLDYTPEIRERLVSSLREEELQRALDSHRAQEIEITPDPSRMTGVTTFDL